MQARAGGCLTGPLAYQRLYRERVTERHDAIVDVVLVVKDVGVGVKRFPDAVSACGQSGGRQRGQIDRAAD